MQEVFKKYFLLFILAFALNLAWEFGHSPLYAHYRGGEITSLVLMRAALADAVMISVLVFLAEKITKSNTFFIAIGGFILAVAIELWALKTGRWAYDTQMPIIPVFGIGLTPAIQLAATGYLSQKITTLFNF